MRSLIKSSLYITATLGVIYATGAADSPAGDIVDIVAGGATAAAALLAADKIDDDDLIRPVEVVVETPQAHAYNWAKQGRPGEVKDD